MITTLELCAAFCLGFITALAVMVVENVPEDEDED